MLFKSTYTKFLEAELARIRAEHKEQLAELKNAHEVQYSHAINLTEQLRDEVDRLRKYLFPGMLTAKETAVVQDSSSPPPTTEDVGGTPFQKIARRVLENEDRKYEAEEKVKEELKKRAQAAVTAAYTKPAESGGQGQVPS